MSRNPLLAISERAHVLSLVGRAVHEGPNGGRGEASASGVAAGARAWRDYRRRCIGLILCTFYERTRLREQMERAVQRLRRVLGMEVVAADTDEVLVRRIAPV